MTDVVGATPLLVYSRIEANRRMSYVLLASFALALLPVVLAPAVVILPFLVSFIFLSSMAPLHGAQSGMSTTLVVITGALAAGSLLAIPLTTAFLIWRYGSRMLLRLARARPLSHGEEPDFLRLVQNLCIGAGLPLPRIHLIESMAANAFATGSDPRTASLVVTRGLLRLLDRRELEGVIAHELSHIGNHDIRLTTTLAALVGVASLPLRFWRFAPPVLLVSLICWSLLLQLILSSVLGIHGSRNLPAVWRWLGTMGPPVYVMFVSPVVALLIRQAVSRQREFLADADAVLLTRDPEALALALVKIGAAGGNRLNVGEGSVHLYFVDPLESGASLLHRMFPSHPPLSARIELLTRMGSGIAPAALRAAQEAGEKIREAEPDEEAVVKLGGRKVDFVRVTTDDGLASSAFQSTLLTMQTAATPNHALTPLYEQPDGWSRVLAHLPEGTVVTLTATDGHFIRVTTAGHEVGYVPSARLTALKNLQT